MARDFDRDICVIGGGGHVGLPFAMTCAEAGLRTVIYDIDPAKVALIKSGRMPFHEEGADELLPRVLESGMLELSDKPDPLSRCRFVLFIIGTPVDEHLNPSFTGLQQALDSCREHLRDGQILIVRSTVYPGTTERLQRQLRDMGLDVKVTCCPERVAQGYSLREFKTLPQLIGAPDEATRAAVKEMFARFTPQFVDMSPTEAELCKLMTNAWRYLQFAIVNQFYMLATTQEGVDWDRILHGCRHDYPRMAGMPGPGLTAGPCLVKDTMQLAAFSHNQFLLGHAAMLVNEGLPMHLVDLARRDVDLRSSVAGILGMAFKAGSDDARDSLSYKLRRLLSIECKDVLCHDPQVPDDRLVPLERVLSEADVLFIGAPHVEYRSLRIPPGKVVVDVWNCLPPRKDH